MNLTQGGTFSQPIYQTILVTVCNGFVYIGQPAPVGTIALAGNQSSAPLLAGVNVSMALINNRVYIVDGVNVAVLDLATSAMVAWAATAGSAPTNVSLAANWRGRLVLAGDSANPQNFYMSRQGTPTDFDYSQIDPAAAFAGNLSKSGQIGEPITALMPHTDDSMFIGCVHSLWCIEGDPADGGTIVPTSESLGVVGPNAWTIDPVGFMYFVANGGLYGVLPGQRPQLLTGQNYDQYFQALSYGGNYISLVWDADLHYLYIFATPTDGQTAGTHLIFDQRNGGLWPTQFPGTQGPVNTTTFLSDASAADRAVLLGGFDGKIRKMDTTATNDDGTAISALLTFGPFPPFTGAAVLTGTTVDFGEVVTADEGASPTKWNVDVTLAAAADAFGVTQGTPHHQATTNCPTERRQKTIRQRLRGGWFSLTLTNSTLNTYFAFESALLEFTQAGRNRERH